MVSQQPLHIHININVTFQFYRTFSHMYSILHSRICIPADKDWNIIPNMYMKYIFDERLLVGGKLFLVEIPR